MTVIIIKNIKDILKLMEKYINAENPNITRIVNIFIASHKLKKLIKNYMIDGSLHLF